MNDLKISINVEDKDGPWGGGNLFIKNLKTYLEADGHKVVFNLFEKDIDVILIIDPRMLSESVNYSIKDIKFYQKKINKNCKVVHRINECDERKNTNGINEYYIEVNKIADYTIFVSDWLKEIYIKSGFSSNNSSVIMSGSNNKIFNNSERAEWIKDEPLRIVTHHWGDSANKGFDIYSLLDGSIKETNNGMIEFTFIGNVNKNAGLKSTNIIEPKFGLELANLIKKNHIYLTASINEPSGNHHIEGAQCGLPILYRNSGGIPEFTKGFGVGFEGKDDFFEQLEEIQKDYKVYFEKMNQYPYNSDLMSYEYLDLFKRLVNSKSDFEIKNKEKEKFLFGMLFYNLNKFLNVIKVYKLKVRIKKYLLIKFPVLKNEKKIV
ncbi:hypothetical protein OA181_03480 [Acidimicrobiaceae bacterium]|nr:hypothetical protein [Acidimicrobiaceae bacterium]